MCKHITLVALLCLIFTSCQSDLTNISEYPEAHSRSSNSITITATKTDNTTLSVSVTKYSITKIGTTHLVLTTNPGMDNSQTYHVFSASIIDSDANMKIVKDPGSNQIVYTLKSSSTVGINDQGQMAVSIFPGNISTTTVSIVGEETDQI